ncbi:MAG: ATP synthase F0 subunit B [Actinomycetes bacterium]
MLTAIVTRSGEAAVSVRLVRTDSATPTETVLPAATEEMVTMSAEPMSDAVPTGETTEVPVAAEGRALSVETGTLEAEKTGPNPIAPENKELLWSFGAFIIFLILMRYFLFPRLRKGMDSRYESIRSNHDGADAAKADARAEVAKYDTALVGVRAEAAQRIDAARQTLDQERQRAIAEVNARIAAKKAEAEAAANAERTAAQAQVSAAVTSVTSTLASLALGKTADAGVVSQAVSEAMKNAGSRS